MPEEPAIFRGSDGNSGICHGGKNTRSAQGTGRGAPCRRVRMVGLSVLLISTYDMGRQPFGLASPAAWLREAGVDAVCVDLARERLSQDAVKAATMVAFFLPMHTATRLALPVIDRVRRSNPAARVVAYGLYAPLNDALLRERGVDVVLGGEFEEDLVRVAVEGAGWSAEALARRRVRRVRRVRGGRRVLRVG